MKIIGIHYTVNDDGVQKSTLHVISEFDTFYSDSDGKRGCVGHKAESIYVGEYDVTNLKVGMQIDVLYDRAISTRNGTYQPIKRIDVLSTPKQQTT